MQNTVEWLRNKGENPYYFNYKPKDGLPRGSIVFFSFEAKIFGQATVKEDLQELSRADKLKPENKKYNFKYTMVFYPIDKKKDIFPEPFLKKKELKTVIRPKKQFGNLFLYLSPNQYQEILRRTMKK